MVGRDRELVWLRATKIQYVGVTRITHQAAMRLGLPQSVTEAYRVRLRLSDEPQFVLRAEGAETLECVKPRNERDNSRTLQPDVIVGWADWNKVQPFLMSGWMTPGRVPPGATTPLHKVAPENEPERQPSGIPQRAAGSDEKADHHHPRGRGESGGDIPFILHAVREDGGQRGREPRGGWSGCDCLGRQAAAGRSGGEGARYLAGCNRHSQYGEVPQSRMEKRGRDRRQERVPDQWPVAWEAEGQRGHQGPGLDVRGICEDREGHRHEGDVRHHQGADSHPAFSHCEAGAEGKWRASMAGSPRRRPEIQQLQV